MVKIVYGVSAEDSGILFVQVKL